MRVTLALSMALLATAASAQALQGTVSSPDDGVMEGVLVTARREGSPMRVTVVSDAAGRYVFPADRLAPGIFTLAIRATGYDLATPVEAHVENAMTTTADVLLRKVADVTPQLTNTEWFMSMPGSDEDKRPLIECMSCHTIERIVRSTHTSGAFVDVLRRMANYANNTTQAAPQRRPAEREIPEERLRKVADYLATINRSRGPWAWTPQILPRPQGRATRVIITQYDLPRATIAPHDVRRDADGTVWYSNFSEPTLGRLDPRTGAHKEYRYPLLKPDAPQGSLAIEADPRGGLWLSLMFQAGLARFDKATETFQMFPVPASLDGEAMQQSMVMPVHSDVDGHVWTNDVARQSILRLTPATGAYEAFEPFRNQPKGVHAPYGLAADAKNNLWFMDFGGEAVGKVDAATGASTLYPTPTPRSRPRRVMFDGTRLWFAEFAANKLAMFDTARERFREFPMPGVHTYPYDAFLDRAGDLWSGNMANDRVLRMNPDSGTSLEYLLPEQTNIRRIFIDNTTTPVTFWAGNNHGAAILKLEPLD